MSDTTAMADPLAQDRSDTAAGLLALAATASLLSACGGGGSGSAQDGIPGIDTSAYRYPRAASDAEAARFLQQAQFSSTEAEIARLRQGTFADWLQAQFVGPTGQSGWDWLERRGYGANDDRFFCFQSYPADFMIWQQLMTSPDAMRKRMALALSEFFVISINASEFNWRSHAVAHWWDTLSGHAFGRFRDLLEAVTLHPTMGWFLNTLGNQKADPESGRVPDENYAREVMQLFTIGLYELNPDGTEKRDGNNRRIETYTQADVTQLARVFTGYDIDARDGERVTPPGQQGDPYTIEGRQFTARPMVLDPDLHSPEAISFLGITIPAGTPGAQALRIALDRLFNHPNVGPFFGRQMIQRLVTSNPSPAYVARVAAAFNNNGSGVRGDLKAVWAAILLDDEARGPQGLSDPYFGKVRELMLRLVHWARSFGATSRAGSWKVGDLSSSEWSLGQSPLRPPSVFNYYRPGFVPPGTPLAQRHATAPEFQTITETTVGSYLNFMEYVIRDGVYVSGPASLEQYPDGGDWTPDITSAYTRELQLVNDPAALVDHLALLLCAGQLLPANRQLIVGTLQANPLDPDNPDESRRNRIGAAIFMIMSSADYLIQK